MTLRDIESLAGRFLPNVMEWSKGFWGSIKSGELWKQLKIWWRANRWFAIISLFLATGLYFRIRENINYNGSRSIPVEVQVVGSENPPSVAPVPSVINVFVRGAENDVRKFETSHLPIRLRIPVDKLENSADGVTIAIKSRRDIPGLREPGLVPTGLSADKVHVTYDPPANVEFFIDPPKHIGAPYHGEVKGVKFSPQTVTLRGGRNMLNSLRERDEVRPQLPLINVENLVDGFTRQYEIKLPDPLAKVATLSSPTSVTVTVEIVRREGVKTFEKLPIRLSIPPEVALPKGSSILPLDVSAKVTGYDLSVAALSNDMVTAYAYVPSASTLNLAPGATNTLHVKLEVPPDKEIWTVDSTPSAVKLIMPAPPTPPPEPASAMTNAAPAVSPQSTFRPSSTNSPGVAASAATPGNPSISNDNTETKDNVENGKPKELK
jgi:hypothetical protein